MFNWQELEQAYQFISFLLYPVLFLSLGCFISLVISAFRKNKEGCNEDC